MSDFAASLGIALPFIQAPMAGVQTSALALAVSRAGGLGFLPAAMLSAEQLVTELDAVLKMPDVRKRLEDGGATPGTGTPASFTQFLKKEKVGYAQIVKSAGIQAE